jgi:hypothetical protein
VISWSNNAAVAGSNAFIFDYVDSINNRIVGGGNPQSIYMGAQTLPLTAGAALGSGGNYWGNIYSNVGIVSASDIKLKEQVNTLPSMTDTVKAVNPISFRWKDKDTRGHELHYGFNADDIHNAFPDDFAGYEHIHGQNKHIRKDQLIAVLWKTCQELIARIEELESK